MDVYTSHPSLRPRILTITSTGAVLSSPAARRLCSARKELKRMLCAALRDEGLAERLAQRYTGQVEALVMPVEREWRGDHVERRREAWEGVARGYMRRGAWAECWRQGKGCGEDDEFEEVTRGRVWCVREIADMKEGVELDDFDGVDGGMRSPLEKAGTDETHTRLPTEFRFTTDTAETYRIVDEHAITAENTHEVGSEILMDERIVKASVASTTFEEDDVKSTASTTFGDNDVESCASTEFEENDVNETAPRIFDTNLDEADPAVTSHTQLTLLGGGGAVTDDAELPCFGQCSPEGEQWEFVRVWHRYRPPSAPVVAVDGGTAAVITIFPGDVIVVHAHQSNGWANGTVLHRNLRGWFPIKFCRSYNDGKIRPLLEGLLKLRCDLRNTSQTVAADQRLASVPNAPVDGKVTELLCLTIESYAEDVNNDIAKLLTATVYFERADVLQLADHDSILRARRTLLGRLCLLMKLAKHAERCRERRVVVHVDDVAGFVRDVLREAPEVMLSGVEFLDTWTERVTRGRGQGQREAQLQQHGIHPWWYDQTEDEEAPTVVTVPVQRPRSEGEVEAEAAPAEVASRPSARGPGATYWGPASPGRCGAGGHTAAPSSDNNNSGRRTLVLHPPGASPASIDRDANFPTPAAQQTRPGSVAAPTDTTARGTTQLSSNTGTGTTIITTTTTSQSGGLQAGQDQTALLQLDGICIHNNALYNPANRHNVNGATIGDGQSLSLSFTDTLTVPNSSDAVVYTSDKPTEAASDTASEAGRGRGVDDSHKEGVVLLDNYCAAAAAGATCTCVNNAQLQASRCHGAAQHAPLNGTVTTGSGSIGKCSCAGAEPLLSRQNKENHSALTLPAHLPYSTFFATFHSPPLSCATVDRSSHAPILASIALCDAHDNFFRLICTSIGAHINTRPWEDIQLALDSSVVLGIQFLEIVNTVWKRDDCLSQKLFCLKNDMKSKLERLDIASRTLADSSANIRSCKRQPLEEHNGLVNMATLCVRPSSDCLRETLSMIERIGDFDLFPLLDLRLSGTFSRIENDENLGIPTRPKFVTPARRESLMPLSSLAIDKLASPLTLSASSAQTSKLRPSPKLRSSTSAILTTRSTAAQDPSARERLVSRPSQPFTSSTITTPPPVTSSTFDSSPTASFSPTLDVAIPRTSTSDFWYTRSSPFSSPSHKKLRPESDISSSAGTASSRISSLQFSDTGNSQASTAATSPQSTKSLSLLESDDVLEFEIDQMVAEYSQLPQDPHAPLLQFCYFHTHELVPNSDGYIRGGTLRAIIEQLTPPDIKPDKTLLRIFCVSFRLHTSPIDFVKALARRFSITSLNIVAEATIKIRVYGLLMHWLEMHWSSQTDLEALPDIAEFALGPLKAFDKTASTRVMTLVDDAITFKTAEKAVTGGLRPPLPRLAAAMGMFNTAVNPMCSHNRIPPPSHITFEQLDLLSRASTGTSRLKVVDFDPLELARQFTLMMSEIYCSIQFYELLGQEWNRDKSKAVNVTKMAAIATNVSNLTIDTILASDSARSRADTTECWIKIATHAYELSNYHLAQAISVALENSSISRLGKTWELVSPPVMTDFKDLLKKMGLSGFYSELSYKMREHAVPCVPLMTEYLKKLTYADTGNLDEPITRALARVTNITKFVNISRYRMTTKIVDQMLRLQVEYALTPVPELQDWLQMEFARVHALLDLRNDSGLPMMDYYAKSCWVEPREGNVSYSEVIRSSPGGLFVMIPIAPTPVSESGGSGRNRDGFWGSLRARKH